MAKLALGFFTLKKINHKAPKKPAKKGRLGMEIKKIFLKEKFTYFSNITTKMKDGVEKKKMKCINTEQKEKLTPENSKFGDDYYYTGVLCGVRSNLTAIDCDSQEAYDFVCSHYDFSDYYTIKTKKGYHIYCAYTDKVKTCINKLYNSLDIINDGNWLFAPPTKYKLLNGSIAEYKYIGGTKLGPFPKMCEYMSEIHYIGSFSKDDIILFSSQSLCLYIVVHRYFE